MYYYSERLVNLNQSLCFRRNGRPQDNYVGNPVTLYNSNISVVV